MNVLVTGGAGFIGRWLVRQLLNVGHQVAIIDNFTNGSHENIEEFKKHPGFRGITNGDLRHRQVIQHGFELPIDICFHLAASINVQDSIDDPETTFENDTLATFYLLEEAKKHRTKIVFMSTCMVYDRCNRADGIRESDATKPASPYAGAKLAAEQMVLSYYWAYGLPTVVIRPFNTYGPYQKSSGEGGVVSIFLKNKLLGEPLKIYGDGEQTRDLLYVEDCARFITLAGYSSKVDGEIIHAGLGQDISISQLARSITSKQEQIQYVPHIHPQSEIYKLLANNEKAESLLNWRPQISLEEGLKRTEEWLAIKHFNGKVSDER